MSLRTRSCLVLLLLPACVAGSAQIHRCVGDNGEPLFSSVPCDRPTAVIAPAPPGEAATGIRPGERAWLRERERRARKPASRKPRGEERGAARLEQRCWKKRRRVESINASLRRGYAPARGERLRRSRRALEAEIRRYCR